MGDSKHSPCFGYIKLSLCLNPQGHTQTNAALIGGFVTLDVAPHKHASEATS